MRFTGRKLAVLALGFAAALSAVFPASAADDGGDSVIGQGKKATLTLLYHENDETGDPIAGASFSCLKVADLRMTTDPVALVYHPVVSDVGGNKVEITETTRGDTIAETVQSAYKLGLVSGGAEYSAETGEDGIARFDRMNPGVYLVLETRPAKEHLPSSPFLLMLPRGDGTHWTFQVAAEPKPVACGDLVISKTVRGGGGETEREFHFTVSLGSEGSYHCRYSTGEEFEVENGSTLALKSGQSARIDTIPAGTQYEVFETEANTEGYTTTWSGAKGTISRKEECVAAFVNEKPAESTPESIPDSRPEPTSVPEKPSDSTVVTPPVTVTPTAVVTGTPVVVPGTPTDNTTPTPVVGTQNNDNNQQTGDHHSATVTNPSTGDTSHAGVWVVLLLTAVMAVIAAAVSLEKKNRRSNS